MVDHTKCKDCGTLLTGGLYVDPQLGYNDPQPSCAACKKVEIAETKNIVSEKAVDAIAVQKLPWRIKQ